MGVTGLLWGMANTRPKTKTVTVMVRLTPAQADDLDQRRHQTPRAVYLANLLHRPEAPVEPSTNRGSPSSHTPDPPRQPTERHLHRYVKQTNNGPVRWEQGQAVWLHRCQCGATKEDQ